MDAMTRYVKANVRDRKKRWLFYVAVFVGFFALYAATAQRGVGWQDSGEFQYRILAGDYRWFSGIARAHPLYIALARGFTALFPKAERLYAANLFSGVGLALALALLAGNVMRLTRSARAAALAVGVLGFAHMAWWLGTVAEVYTWSLALLMAEVLCLIRYAERRSVRWLILLFGVNGAHMGIHNAALLGLPVYAYLLAAEVWRGRMRAASVVCGCAVAWLAGGGMIVWQAACLLRVTGDPAEVLKSVLFGAGYERQVLGTAGFELKRWAANTALAGVSLMNPCWLFAGRGFLAGRPSVRGAGTGAGIDGGGTGTLNAQRSTLNAQVTDKAVLNWLRVLTALHAVFWVRYFVADQATFVLPTLGLLAVWVGVGAGGSSKVRECEMSKVADKAAACGAGTNEGVTRTPNAQRSTLNVQVMDEGEGFRQGVKAQRWGLWLLAAGVACAVAGPWLLNVAVERTGVALARGRVLPFRNEVRYWLLPWKQREASAERFVTEAGETLRAGDVLFADSTAAAPLLAAREAGTLSTGWRLVTPWSGETDREMRELVREWEGRVFVVSPVAGYAPAAVLDTAGGFEREGVVYRAVGSRQSAVGNGGGHVGS
jgi:hypothetical protein